MNRSRRLLLTSLALVAVFSWGAADAAPPGQAGQPWGTAPPAKPGAPGNGGGHWDKHFQGRGNITQTRCQGMSRGANCITPALRKEAARRAAAARDVADATAPPTPPSRGAGGTSQ